MPIIPIDTTFRQETGKKLSNTSQLKMFNMLENLRDNKKFMNIFRSFIVNDSIFNNARYYNLHEVDSSDWLDTIAYQYYENDSLWWIIAMTNNIVNPFEELEEGNFLRILKPQYIYNILKEIQYIGQI
jgi:hypothetical protein